MQGITGSQLVTADLAVGTSGKPIRVYAMHILSGGGGGGIAILRNGTTTGGTAYVQETGTTSTGKSFEYGRYGFLFPDGCFCDIDANVTSALVEFSKEA